MVGPFENFVPSDVQCWQVQSTTLGKLHYDRACYVLKKARARKKNTVQEVIYSKDVYPDKEKEKTKFCKRCLPKGFFE